MAMSSADRGFPTARRREPLLTLITGRWLRSRPAPVLRDWAARIAIGILFFMMVVGTKPLQVRVASMASAEGDPARQILYLAALALLLLASQIHRRPQRLLVFPISIAVLLLWCALSVRWAIDPDISARRLILTVMIMWTIFRAVGELGYAKALATIRLMLAVALVLNLIAVLISPAAIHQFGERVDPNLAGDWRGFLMHKNFAGALCALTVIFFLFDGRDFQGWNRLNRWLVVAGAAFFLVMTTSQTSINMLIVAIVAAAVYGLYSPTFRVLLVPVATIAIAVIVWAVDANFDRIVAPLSGNDPTLLTGRIVIWPVLLAFARDHLLLGAGFNSFWNIGPDGPVFRYNDDWVSEQMSGHNGYLDLLVTIGLPGLLLALVALVVLPVLRLLASTRIPRPAARMLFAAVVFCAGHNFTESSFLERDMLVQVMLMFTLALLHVSGGGRRPWSKQTPAMSPMVYPNQR